MRINIFAKKLDRMFNDNVTYKLVPLQEDKKTIDNSKEAFQSVCLSFEKGLAKFSTPIAYVENYRTQHPSSNNSPIPSEFEVFAYSDCFILPVKNIAHLGIEGYYKVQKIK